MNQDRFGRYRGHGGVQHLDVLIGARFLPAEPF